MRFLSMSLVLVATFTPLSLADTYTITNDTYLDSFYTTDQNGNIVTDLRRYNYGAMRAIKAVVNDGSGTTYGDRDSLVRGLFTLPASFWTTLGNQQVSSATVSFRVLNEAQLDGRQVKLQPLTHTFEAGEGGDPTKSNLGEFDPQPINTPLAPIGADWFTYNGVDEWGTPGGDSLDTVAATVWHTRRPAASSTPYFDWDIAPLLNDPTLRNLVQTNGLMMSLSGENSFAGNDFASLWSADGRANLSDPPSNPPTVTFVVPEPTSATAIFVVSGMLLGRRRWRIK